MQKLQNTRVWRIPSESDPEKAYKVQYDGVQWYCECPSWIYNHRVKHNKIDPSTLDPYMSRSCKHTDRAKLFWDDGIEVPTLGPWYEELRTLTGYLMQLNNGNMDMTKERWVEMKDKVRELKERSQGVRESLDTADTYFSVAGKMMKQLVGQM